MKFEERIGFATNEIIKMLKSYGMTNIKLNLHGDTADKITVKITGQMNRK